MIAWLSPYRMVVPGLEDFLIVSDYALRSSSWSHSWNPLETLESACVLHAR
jgi:hypothetical protein